uniref:probable RNA-binding protein 18 isoform X2 n=1 Tax=Oncorhynchus gorbuscha TaxID=8017 RepID=UPI001EAF2836|nr:probable RNA-binding protein 18 isoform X2 [Oncorhynchus gorbuscha]
MTMRISPLFQKARNPRKHRQQWRMPLSFQKVRHEGHRLWIGNIDPKITEYHLVKLMERFGKVKQFDFLFHKSGPMEGPPRRYCFVNFHTKEEAEWAIHCLNGKLALSKKLVVRWVHAQLPHNACGFDQKQHQTNSDTPPAWSMVRLS